MSFTTLEAVNFVFVRPERRDGLTGWGETIERSFAPWLAGRAASRIESLRQEMARRITEHS